MEVYQRVLSTMPQTFSTNQYLERLKTVSSNEQEVRSGKHVAFIKSECHKLSNRTYMKLPKQMQLMLESRVDQPVLNEQNAADLLKSLGYKLLKPVKDWVEI